MPSLQPTRRRFFGSYPILAERFGTITTFAVHEIVEIRRPAGTGQVLATNADKGTGEIGRSRRRRLVRQDARIQWTGQPGPLAAGDAVREIEALEIDFHAQMHRRSRGNPDRRAENIRLKLVGQTRHDPDVLTQLRIVRDVEVVKLAAAVIADQAGHLLEAVGLELHHGRGGEAVRLLAAGNQGLAEEATQRLAAVKA